MQVIDLIDKSKRRDQDNVLNTTLLSSDMGTLFMLLNRALDRDGGAD